MMSQDFERGLDELQAGAAQAHAAQMALPTADLVRRARRHRRARAAGVTLATAAAVAGLGLGTVAAVDWFGPDVLPPASTPEETAPLDPTPEPTQPPTSTPEQTPPPETPAADLLDPGADRMDGDQSPTPGDPLTDGSYIAFVRGIDPVAGTIDADMAIFMTGQAAVQWLTENEPDAEIPPPNDFVIVNEVERVRTLPVADVAPIWDVCFDGDSPWLQRDIAQWAAAPELGELTCSAGPELGRAFVYWLDVRDGVVVQVVGQYIP